MTVRFTRTLPGLLFISGIFHDAFAGWGHIVSWSKETDMFKSEVRSVATKEIRLSLSPYLNRGGGSRMQVSSVIA